MMKRCLSLLLVIVMALGLFAGCSSSDSEEETVSLTIGVGAQFTTMDPGLNTEVINSYVMTHTWSGLFRKNDDNEVVTDLAESYEVSDDGLTYTVYLKEGLKWSDGEDLTADDFVYAVKRNLTYGAENAWATNDMVKYLEGADEYANNSDYEVEDLDDFTGVVALDDTTLQFNLIKPCTFFTSLLTNEVFMPLREDFVEAHGSDWCYEVGYPSCGAYILTEINENEKAVIVKNEYYYDADNITIDEMTFMVMTDTDAQESAFTTGELDIALGVSVNVVDNYEDQDAVWLIPSSSIYFININSGETGPDELKDVNVRRALALSIDKEAMSEVLGDLYPAATGYVPSGVAGVSGSFRDEADPMLEYDLEEAIALLEEAGYNEDNPLTLTYKYSDSQIHSDIAQLLQQQWANAGIVVELEVVESGVYYDQMDSGDFEIGRYGYIGSTDPSQFLDLWTTSMQVTAVIDDEVYDQMMDEASYIVDLEEYMEAMHEAEYYLVEEMVYLIPLFDYSSVGLMDPNIDGVVCPAGSFPFFGYCTIAEDAE